MPLPKGKMVLPPGEHLPEPPVDKLAPGNTAEYRRMTRELLADFYGSQVVPCRLCGRPMISGYQCRWCRGEQ